MLGVITGGGLLQITDRIGRSFHHGVCHLQQVVSEHMQQFGREAHPYQGLGIIRPALSRSLEHHVAIFEL